MVEGARSGSASDAGGTWHRLRPFQPAGQRLPYGKDQRRYAVRQKRFPQHRATVFTGEPEGESGDGGSGGQICSTEKGDAGSDRARLVACAETLDRADPRHDQAAPAGRKHWSGEPQTFARGAQRVADRGVKDRGARRPVSRGTAKDGGPLRGKSLIESEQERARVDKPDRKITQRFPCPRSNVPGGESPA